PAALPALVRPAPRLPPLSGGRVSRAAGEPAPPQVSVAFGGFAITSPAGNVSVNATPVNATVALGLVIVNDRVVVWPTGTNDAPKALVIVGGATTVIVAGLLDVSVPPFPEGVDPCDFFFSPPLGPVPFP